jgi:F-type H+-transporting ATPase subunit gamma
VRTIQDTGGRPDVDLARELSDELLERFSSGRTDAVHFCYPAFVTLAINRPTVSKFLSLDAESLAESAGGRSAEAPSPAREIDYILEPSPERVFNSLLPRYLTSRVYITLAELFTSEHSARMIAMNNATKNCDELGDSMTIRLNKARQAQITGELIDIVGGAQAV